MMAITISVIWNSRHWALNIIMHFVACCNNCFIVFFVDFVKAMYQEEAYYGRGGSLSGSKTYTSLRSQNVYLPDEAAPRTTRFNIPRDNEGTIKTSQIPNADIERRGRPRLND